MQFTQFDCTPALAIINNISFPNSNMLRRIGQLGLASGRQRCQNSYKLGAVRRLFSTETADAAAETTVKETYRAKKRKFGVGTALLCLIPPFTFYLGCWQVQRLRWKVNYIKTLEDRLHREAIPLPKRIK